MSTSEVLALHPAPQRIVIFRALQLGDMLCAVPALRALRRAWPAARITLIGLPWARAFVARYRTLIDELMVFPGAPGFPEQAETAAGLPRFFAAARAQRFDLAIQMHGSGGIANDLLLELGARANAGFVQPGEQREGKFIAWPDRLREAERYLALVRALGIPANDSSLWFPLSADDRAEAAEIIELRRAHRGYAIVHAGAQLPSRRWPAQRFAEAADALAEAGWRIFLTGTTTEAPLVERVRAAMSHDAVSLAGCTSLGGVAALVERADIVICNDTGISHIAAALRTPSVVIACGSDTARWAPANGKLHRVIADYPECRPCMFAYCPHGHACALAVSSEAVSAAAFSLLDRPNVAAGSRRTPVTTDREHDGLR